MISSYILTILLCFYVGSAFKLANQKVFRLNVLQMSVFASLNDRILMENAERLGRRERDLLLGKKSPIEIMEPLPLKSLEKRLKNGSSLVNTILLKDGCVSLRDALSKETANSLAKYVSAEKFRTEAAVADGSAVYDELFGAVNNRRHRSDMFLPFDEPIVQRALLEVTSNLRPILDELEGMLESGILHELSSFISDPGSPNQCVHCDTPFLSDVEPLYTFFVALQDVDDNMGHTTYLPGTHNQAAHRIFNGPQRQKDDLIASSKAVRSNLKIGDVVIFDSRVLHCGGANTSEGTRRILFYFTFTAGNVEANNPNPSRGMGSIRKEDQSKYFWTEISRKNIGYSTPA